ncbi:preprotein translocase subunit SecE [bacterium]|nr:preprotein translocase subunit SecE [bacterium]
MSRLQKKKIIDKNKKRSKDLDESTDQSSSSIKSSTSMTSKTVSTPKQKIEKKSVDTITSEPNFFQKSIEFLREVQVELKKVTWPTRKQTTGTTIVVIIFVFVVAAFLGVFDLGLSKLVQVVLT